METAEWQQLDAAKFYAGHNDSYLAYPVDLLYFKGLAFTLGNNGKGNVEVNLNSRIIWNANDRGVYRWQ